MTKKRVNKRRDRPEKAKLGRAANEDVFSPKAIVFDFEGTLTKPDTDHTTTWERLWIQLGYDDNECGKLEHRYFKREIDHEQGCQLTLERFKERGLTQDAVRSLGRSIKLIDGFAATIERIHQGQIPMYIVSGSIWDVVSSALGEFTKYFARGRMTLFTRNWMSTTTRAIKRRLCLLLLAAAAGQSAA